MPTHQSRHVEETRFELSNFLGGWNPSVPPTDLADNECEVLQNFYLDPASGKPTTRYPLEKYSTSAPSANNVTALYYWNSIWWFACNQKLYYLDANKAPVEVGGVGKASLSGSDKPSMTPFNNKLLIATDGALQRALTTSTSLAAVANAPKASMVLEKDSRVWVGGDSDNLDRVWASGYFDETSWSSTSLAMYMDVGYKDGLEVAGLKEFREVFVVFKRGNDQAKTFYASALSTSAPVVRLVSDTHCLVGHGGVAEAAGNLYIMEPNTVTVLAGTDAQGKLAVDPVVGRQVANQFTATADGFAVVYPPDKQIWFIPDITLGNVYVCHYLLNNVWSIFKFHRKITSAFYNPGDRYLYLGCDDGFIYRYNRAATDYSDEDGDGSTYGYTAILRTKAFGEKSITEHILKDPMISYTCAASGSAQFLVLSDYGRTGKYASTFSPVHGNLLSELTGTYLYDTQVGGSAQMYLYDQNDLSVEKFRVNLPVEGFQFEIRTTTGAIALNTIIVRGAAGRRK